MTKKNYLTPRVTTCETIVSNIMALSGNNGITDGGNASEQGNPRMDAMEESEMDIWMQEDYLKDW